MNVIKCLKIIRVILGVGSCLIFKCFGLYLQDVLSPLRKQLLIGVFRTLEVNPIQ